MMNENQTIPKEVKIIAYVFLVFGIIGLMKLAYQVFSSQPITANVFFILNFYLYYYLLKLDNVCRIITVVVCGVSFASSVFLLLMLPKIGVSSFNQVTWLPDLLQTGFFIIMTIAWVVYSLWVAIVLTREDIVQAFKYDKKESNTMQEANSS